MSGRAAFEGLLNEMAWFGVVLSNRLIQMGLMEGESEEEELPALEPEDAYGQVAAGLEAAERLVLILALLPHIKPETLSGLLSAPERQARFLGFSSGSVVKPTLQTALTLLSGGEAAASLAALPLFAPEGRLLTRGLMRLEKTAPGEVLGGAVLEADEEVVSKLLWGRPYEPSRDDFPAARLATRLSWDDLALPVQLFRQLDDILEWAAHGGLLESELGLGKHLRPGFKVLFHGPPGTGKTLAAALLGQKTGWPVYRIDLSQMVSKYIGETEKNLERLFRLAEKRRWILFFDEADALFNRRTEVTDAHDRHANQETAYLLQRLENFPGLVIMSSNLTENIDPAFTRRFNCGLFFPMPARHERERLWRDSLGPELSLAGEDWDSVLDHELSGGQIANIVLRLGLWAIRNGKRELPPEVVRRNITLEMVLEGKA